MDIWSKIFRQVGVVLAVILLIVVIMALSTAENGQLSVEGLEKFSDTFNALYSTLIIVIYPWMALALFLFGRLLYRMFKGR